jgi:hypothetical protein
MGGGGTVEVRPPKWQTKLVKPSIVFLGLYHSCQNQVKLLTCASASLLPNKKWLFTTNIYIYYTKSFIAETKLPFQLKVKIG